MITRKKATKLRSLIEKAAISLSDEEALCGIELFPHWSAESLEYEANKDRVSFDEALYKCIMSHTSQESWRPDVSPSLWVRVDDPSIEWPEWIQPLGSTDAYPLGAKVSHNEKHWTSDYVNNIWEPGVYGWTEVS